MHWRYVEAIGVTCAALIGDDDVALSARIDIDDDRLRVGAVHDARAVRIEAQRHAIVAIGKHEAIVMPRPPGWHEGATVRVEVVREALTEWETAKRARVRPAGEQAVRPALTLREEIDAIGLAVEVVASIDAVFAEDDDRDVLDEAINGRVGFDVGLLHVEPTRAMTMIDVDGLADAPTLAVRAASIAALPIRRFDLTGSIGIDFPSVDRVTRAAAAAFDAALPQPFERTAINGFGLMQIVRPRVRASLIELVRHEAATVAAAFALDRLATGDAIGAHRLVVAASVAAVLGARPDWLARVARRIGGAVTLRAEPAMPIWSSYAERA